MRSLGCVDNEAEQPLAACHDSARTAEEAAAVREPVQEHHRRRALAILATTVATLAAAGVLALVRAPGRGANLRAGVADAVNLDGVDVNLLSYWDEAQCGPAGDDHNIEWCGATNQVANCAEYVSISTSICPSGAAKLHELRGKGGTSWEVQVTDYNCNFAFLAEYRCVDRDSDEAPRTLEVADWVKSGECKRIKCGEAKTWAECLNGVDERYVGQDATCMWCGGGPCTDTSSAKCQAMADWDQAKGTFLAGGRYTLGRCFDQTIVDLPLAAANAVVLPAEPKSRYSVEQSTVLLLTMETFNSRTWLPVKGVPGRWYRNVGATQGWKGWISKVSLYRTALFTQAAVDPDRIVVLMDTDIWVGGCTDDELLEQYHRLVEASDGATVVVGGDPDVYPNVGGVREALSEERFQRRRAKVLKAFGLTVKDLTKWYDVNREDGWSGFDYAFANAGWMMGPAKDLLSVLSCIAMTGRESATFDDQRGCNKCVINHPDHITIDYTTSLVFTSYHMKNLLEVVDPQTVKNRLTGTRQCFIHADVFEQNPLDEWLFNLPNMLRNAR